MPATVLVSRTARRAYRTIADAVADARSPRITVDSGIYEESLALRDVELSAVDGAAVRIVASGGATVETRGSVVLRGLTVTNYNGTAVRCQGGTTQLLDCQLRGQGKDSKTSMCVDAKGGTELVMRSCTTRSGRVRLTGASGTFEDCRFLESDGNGLTVWDDSAARLTNCTIDGASSSGLWCATSKVRVERCEVGRSGKSGLSADDGSQLTVADTVIHDAATAGVYFDNHATGAVERSSVQRAERGVSVIGSEVELSSVAVSDVMVSGIMLRDGTRTRVTDCTVRGAGRYGMFVGYNADPTVERLDVTGAEVGIWLNEGRGRFTDVSLSGNDVAVRCGERTYARFDVLSIARAGLGVEALHSYTSVELTEATITEPTEQGIRLGGEVRLTAERCAVTKAQGTAIELAGDSRLTVSESTVTAGRSDGVLVGDRARIDATGLTVRGCAGAGVWGKDSARVLLRGSTLTGNSRDDLRIEDDCAHTVLDSTVGSSPAGRRPVRARAGASGSDEADPAIVVPAPGDPVAELAELIGLAPVKRQVRTQVNLIRVAQQREAAGLPAPPLSRHLVFSGPSGTGKTTVARLYGQILASLGVLATGEVHEVTRSQLVGQYLGSTAIKTREAFTAATGGVLFIDEAYALARTFGANSDFGQEAIDELVTLMENRREDVVVIAAGYTDEMNTFLDANPGLRSRYSRIIEFPSYSPEELAQITELIADRNHYRLDEPVLALLRGRFDRLADADQPGNARGARSLFEAMVERHAERLSTVDEPGAEDLQLLRTDDLPAADDHP